MNSLLEQQNARVVHVVEDASYANFGVSSALAELVAHFPEGYSCEVCTVNNSTREVDPRLGKVCGVNSHRHGKAWRYSPQFGDALETLTTEHTLIHIHGLWMAPQYQAARFALAQGIPFVITPHNMLGGWLWTSSRVRQLKKSLYWHLLSRRPFVGATVVHALTEVEREALRPFFPRTEIAVIPNGISLDVAEMQEGALFSPPVEGKYLFFLGRLHPVKGLEILLLAMSRIPHQMRMNLIIAGAAHTEEYRQKLLNLVSELGLTGCVRFVGLVGGALKWSYLKHAWALCAPSYSEGMSMVALEGMASATPLLTTYASGLSDLEKKGAGLLSRAEVDGVHHMLQQAHAWSETERGERGHAALAYVRENYAWDRVSELYAQLYAYAMGK